MLAHSAQSPLLNAGVKCASFNILLTLPYKVANRLSTRPFCCGVFGAEYSKSIPKPFALSNCSVVLFSPAPSHRIFFTCFPFVCKSRTNFKIVCAVSLFFLRKKLKAYPVASSNTKSQYFAPPKLLALIELISMCSRSPTTLHLRSSVTDFGTFFCRALASAHAEQTSNFPTSLTP